MIIDCHTHIWPSRQQLNEAQHFSCLVNPERQQAQPAQHQQACGPADMVCVLGFRSGHLGADIPNEFIADYVVEHPNRLIGFAGFDPGGENPGRQLDEVMGQKVFRGVTMSPACQNVHPCDSRAMRCYERLEQEQYPVYVLQGEKLPKGAVLDYAQPWMWDEPARTFPGLKLILSHVGYPFVEQTIALLAKHENVYADVAGLTRRSWQAYRTLNLAYEYGVLDKLLFGSDYPHHDVKSAVESLYNLNKISLDTVLPAVPREHIRGIIERDSLSLLGLGKSSASQPSS